MTPRLTDSEQEALKARRCRRNLHAGGGTASRAPIRDVGPLGSAVARPQTTAFGEDAYPDIWTKAAALLHSIVKNHALVDGNKRLGWLATAVLLELSLIHI